MNKAFFAKQISAIGVCFLLVIFIATSCKGLGEQNNTKGNMPIYKNAYDVKQGFDSKMLCEYAIYKVNMPFPANEVIAYYENEISKLSLIKLASNGEGFMEWKGFNYDSGQWEKTDKAPAKLVGTWVDQNKEKMIILQMFYKYDGKNDGWDRTLLVDYKLCKYFEEYNRATPPGK